MSVESGAINGRVVASGVPAKQRSRGSGGDLDLEDGFRESVEKLGF